jgi:hypothetical protein
VVGTHAAAPTARCVFSYVEYFLLAAYAALGGGYACDGATVLKELTEVIIFYTAPTARCVRWYRS